jgi:RNA polymerase sigma-70 factor, ECF subfamily
LDETRASRQAGEFTDDELVALVGQASPSDSSVSRRAFEELFSRYHAKVMRWCLRVIGDDSTAEDVCQAIFLELIDGASKYDPRQRFGAWLYVMTRSRCLNALRHRSRQHEESDDSLATLLVDDRSPLSSLEREELRSQVQRVCRERLNEREQQVIHLRYTWELPVDEITRALGLTNASGARTHIRSAEEKLRRFLKSFASERQERE